MGLVKAGSLAATVDAVNDAFFYGRKLSESQRRAVAKWITGCQGAPGAYANMFAPTARDFEAGIRVFTGEPFKSRAGVAHKLGQEACRALSLLDVGLADVREALEKANKGIAERVRGNEPRRPGMYCCGSCSVAMWRNLAVGGLYDQERILAEGMKALKAHRDDKGKWGIFPFWYTLLAISDIDLPGALIEKRYAAPGCERLLKRRAKDDKHDKRRRVLAERILSQC
ncbi:MAG: hypothetical protein J7M19_08660 [Planctomycetes bacterium]|nr:hypothetical protein [Planctomycetota bacterium]